MCLGSGSDVALSCFEPEFEFHNVYVGFGVWCFLPGVVTRFFMVFSEYGCEDLGLFFGWECVDPVPEVVVLGSVE